MEKLIRIASRFGTPRRRLAASARNAAVLFAGASRLHPLPPEWERYLMVAALFRDSGKSISPLDYPAHSYHVVKSAGIASLRPSEIKVVAELCRDFRVVEPCRARKLTTESLRVLLRVIDELELPEASIPALKVAADEEDQFTLKIARCRNFELRKVRVLRAETAFFDTFGKKLRLIQAR